MMQLAAITMSITPRISKNPSQWDSIFPDDIDAAHARRSERNVCAHWEDIARVGKKIAGQGFGRARPTAQESAVERATGRRSGEEACAECCKFRMRHAYSPAQFDNEYAPAGYESRDCRHRH